MSLSFNNLCIEDNTLIKPFFYPSPENKDHYKVFPSFDKMDALEEASPTSTEGGTNSFPTPHLSPTIV